MQKIPENFKPYFWDVDFDNLDPEKSDFFVIERLLEKGRMEQVRWVFDKFKDKLIRQVVVRSPNITKQTRTFWNLYFSKA